MPERTMCDLSHHFARCFKLGRLMTVARIPTLPGDSMEINVEGRLNLAELRRPLPFDIRVDIFGFWCPLRHSYEGFELSDAKKQNWQAYIMAGADKTGLTKSTAPTVYGPPPSGLWDYRQGSTADSINPAFLNFVQAGDQGDGVGLEYLLYPFNVTNGGKVPRHVAADYSRIWRHFFSDPHNVNDVNAPPLGGSSIARDVREFGYKVCNLKTLTSTPRKQGRQIDTQDWLVPHETHGSLSGIDIRDFREKMLQYRSETKREFFATRYNEIIKMMGGRSSVDEQPRPTYLGRKIYWLSGHPVSGTDEGNMGSETGNASGIYSFRIPRRFFGEHGTVWVMFVLRVPPIYRREIHRLDIEAQFKQWHTLINEPGFSDKLPREQWTEAMFFAGGDNTVVGEHPVQMHYRTHPSNIHHRFLEVEHGFPYQENPSQYDWERMVFHPDFGEGTSLPIFRSEPFGHGTWKGVTMVDALRPLAPVEDSLLLT